MYCAFQFIFWFEYFFCSRIYTLFVSHCISIIINFIHLVCKKILIFAFLDGHKHNTNAIGTIFNVKIDFTFQMSVGNLFFPLHQINILCKHILCWTIYMSYFSFYSASLETNIYRYAHRQYINVVAWNLLDINMNAKSAEPNEYFQLMLRSK